MTPLKNPKSIAHRVRGTGFYIENLKRSLLQYYPNNKYTFFIRGEKLPKDVDLVHYPYFEPFFLTLPIFSKYKRIVTVHDLTPLIFPKEFPKGVRGKIKWELQKQALKHVDGIITDSVCSKNDIIKHAGISGNKIYAIHLAAGDEFKMLNSSKFRPKDDQPLAEKFQSLRKKYNLPEKFVLYVGDVTWNKNLPRLVEAIKRIDLALVMVGSALMREDFDRLNPWNKDLLNVQKSVEFDKRIIRLGFIPQQDLVLLYNEATVFAMPSLYEGFGLPILEAMSCGCPVISSKEGSLGEIAGDAAYFVDAYNIDDIAGGIKKVFEDKSMQKSLSDKGLLRAKKFTWKKTAEETMKVYSGFAKPSGF